MERITASVAVHGVAGTIISLKAAASAAVPARALPPERAHQRTRLFGIR
jgi:hypothetical protein